MDECLAITGNNSVMITFVALGLIVVSAIIFFKHTRPTRHLGIFTFGLSLFIGSVVSTSPLYASASDPFCTSEKSTSASSADTSQPHTPQSPIAPGDTPPSTPQASLNLPRIAWEGGSSYYSQFPSAAGRGWADPAFFPIALWWGVFENDSHVQWDKSHGINTYIVTNPDDPNAYSLIERNGMSWIGGQLPGSTRDSVAWVGDFLDDEVDGRFSPEDGQAYLQNIINELPDHNKLRYTNYTSMIVNIWFNNDAGNAYVNNFTDAVSMDMYFYTVPFCSWEPFPTDYYRIQIPEQTCRTSASYGKLVDMLRQRDAADGKLQPIWNFVENVSGSPAEQDPSTLIAPEQVKGAAMSSIIHEARGLVWFNNVFAGPCSSGNALRSAQVNPTYPCAAQITAMGEVNNQLHRLAPILNTQSYQWSFGQNLETMLKVYGDSAYIFAMPDGTSGSRTFTLPPELVSKVSVEVIDESRTLPITAGSFSDHFEDGSTYHIYKISLGS